MAWLYSRAGDLKKGEEWMNHAVKTSPDSAIVRMGIAAWLLEQAGFHKGFAKGRAGISSRHTLALINRGGAAATDIKALRDEIIRTVETRFGIKLQQEPVELRR